MFPVSEANFFSEKKNGFLTHSGHKQQQRLCRILGGVDLVAAGEMGIWRYDANGGGGGD